MVQNTNLSYFNGNRDQTMLQPDFNVYYWDAVDYAAFHNRVESVPVEVTAGIRMFSFLNLTLGGGAAYSKAESSMQLLRTGRLINGNEMTNWAAGNTASTDLAALYSYPYGLYTLSLPSQKTEYRTLYYIKQGTEFDFYILKITYELYGTAQGVQGGTIGLRIEI
jgi:hypothetical protein